MATILLLSTADTELLAARNADAGYRTANPARVTVADLAAFVAGADLAVVRLLGGRKAWPEGIEALRRAGLPLIALGGEAAPDAELMALSTVPAGIAAQALAYLREGGRENLRELAAFLSDTVLLTGEGFAPPSPMPQYGVHRAQLRNGALADAGAPPRDGADGDDRAPGDDTEQEARRPGERETRRPVIAVVYYRAHELSGNTAFVETLCAALEQRGAEPFPVFCGSLRNPPNGLIDLLTRADAVITTVLAAGGAAVSAAVTAAGSAAAGDGDGDGSWEAGALAGLGVPIIQGLCLTSARAEWAGSEAALSPMDAAMQVAIPEFDGRLIAVPFSFKEEGPDGIPVYRADPERALRLAGIAVRHARLRHTPNSAKRIAIMLSSYPTKHARVGNAVGLDTPASAVRLLEALRRSGYDLGPGFPQDGDALIHALIAAGGHDTEWLSEEQLRAARARVPGTRYGRWLGHMPNGLRERIVAHWGDPPGELYVDTTGNGAEGTDGGAIVLAALVFGNVALMIQPPRGFGENPVAIYHDPDLPPSHHYVAAYRWLEEVFRADAIVHLGKHGTLEWLPGKGLGLSGECAPDQVLREVPLVYPFIVNDPGEGTQAKRRAHATIVDHLVPPMARADTYGDLAKLEQLLDEYATVQALDPAKLPAVRAQIWTLVRAAQLHHDLQVAQQPGEAEFGDFVLHIDGYLCEVKDAAIRDGLHVLGVAPSGQALVNLVGVILRSAQVWGGRSGALPGLRVALGVDEASASRAERDNAEEIVRRLLEGMDAVGWDPARAEDVCVAVLGPQAPPAPDAPATSNTSAAPNIPAGPSTSAIVPTSATPAAPTPPETSAISATSPAPATLATSTTPETPETTGTLATPATLSAPYNPATSATAGGPAPGASSAAAPAADRCDHDRGPSAAYGAGAGPRSRNLRADVVRVLRFAAAEVVPRLAATRGEIDAVLRALDGGYIPAGPSGSPTRGLVTVLPTGRNFYSVDPKAIPSRAAWDTGSALAESLLARHLADEGDYPRCVGLTVWGTSAMRTQGDDIAEVLALIGCRPTWDDASRRVTGFEIVPTADLGRPRIDVTLRISGFFRDALPHVVGLMDDAIAAVADLDEALEDNFVRAHALEDVAGHGDWRRATTRIFGSKPGAYGAGLLPLIDARNWRDDADLAEVYAVWGGYAYGRRLDGRVARRDMETAFRRIAVAAKNQDNREHDIVDSDDYFQYHGGMVAMVRALTGRNPVAYVGDSAVPDVVKTRTLAEETHRVFRARVVNPRWIAAMRRHGYKGAFELAATVDYLFGYDATASVVADWMYEQLAASYVFDEQTRQFMRQSNPWALRGIAERLLEAAQRGLWAEPDQATLEALHRVYLDLEGDLEEGS
jgi:cobaltochelatase CobN